MTTTITLSVALLSLALLVAVAPPAAADAASDEARILSLIKQARSSTGASALRIDAGLSTVARGWAAKMARDGALSHNRDVGSQVTASKLSENVGYGGTVDVVHNNFLNSPPHRTNMVDAGVNAVGVGVAYANGLVYVVQDYGQLPTASPNLAPAVPTQLTPANGVVHRSPPSHASARYSDPEGSPGAVFFLMADDQGRIVRQAWSPVVCSGCVANVSFAALPDGSYGLYTAAVDGTLGSAVSAPSIFTVNRSAPHAPSGLHRAGGNAVGVYADADGTPGWLYVLVYGPGGALVSHGFTARVCSGCTATYALPALGGGTYDLYAIAYDGLASPTVGPVPFVV